MKDLSRLSGLPLGLDVRQGRLEFPDEALRPVEPALYMLDDLRPELLNPDSTGNEVVAGRYADIGLPADRGALEAGGLQYDLVVLRPGMLGPEFAKSPGCRAQSRDGRPLPQVLELLHGTGLLLLQKEGERPGEVADAVLIEAAPGEKLVVPPGYGYVAINLGRQPLVLAGLMARNAVLDGEPYQRWQGAAYYAVLDEEDEPVLVVNETYGDVAELRMLPVEALPDVELGLVAGRPLYQLAVEHPERFAYLSAPEGQARLLELPVLDDPDADEDDEG